MAKDKRSLKSSFVIVVLVILALTGGTYYLLKIRRQQGQPSAVATTENNQTVQSGAASTDFTYTTPVGWYQLSQSVLDSVDAINGIGHGTSPDAFFYVSSDASANRPANAEQLKTIPLNTLEKIPGFKLVKTAAVKVDEQNGQEFIYLAGDSPQTKNQLIAVIKDNKVYLILITSSTDKFDDNQKSFDSIISSFKFR